MARVSANVRVAALALKVAGLVAGVFALTFSLALLYDEFTFLSGAGDTTVGDVVIVLAAVALALSGAALIAQLPESLWARFSGLPEIVKARRPVYGLGTLLAIGIGATLGSPLFILIPENIEQYELVSVASLVLATVLSVAMAKVYSDMYRESRRLGVEGVGGPSFTKVAVGARSVRYFVSRLSMWVSNTALAAYTKIVFLIFVLDPQYFPAILGAYGFSPTMTDLIIYTVAGAFIGWTILNILFEQKYLRLLGLFQIAMASILILILVYHSAVLGSSGGWNLSGIFSSVGSGWASALVVNTGYLYLLFFGFQEVQSLERDSLETSKVPLLSWLKKDFTLDRTAYLGVAMILSVVIASAVNIFYGLAVYSAHVSLQGSAIPALYLAGKILGPGQELLVSVAFLLATVTTFVPAFLAASRHLEALGEDGYMPRSMANLSWVFTLIAILLLAIGSQAFLVNVTDFMVLISLGIISLSAIWLRSRSPTEGVRGRWLALFVGLSCFVFGGAVYFVNPTVAVFGSMAVIFAYLIFDIIELGTLGAQLFLAVFGLISTIAISGFKHAVYAGGIVSFVTQFTGVDPNSALFWGLLASSLLLAGNVLLDIRILKRTSVR